MNIKFLFVLGFLSISVFAEEQNVEPEKPSQPEKEALAEAKAEINFGDVKKDDESVNKEAVENIENIDNGIKASASASASFNFNFEELIAKLFEAFEQNKENVKDVNNDEETNKKEEDNEEAEDNAQSKENQAEKMKSPFINSYNVHARASASARSSSSSSSSFYFNFYDPKEEKEGDEGENTEKAQENDDIVAESQENDKEDEQQISIENVEIPEHCNQQNIEDKKPSLEEPLKTEDKTRVEEVDQ